MLKPIIIMLFILVLASLSSSLLFLFKDAKVDSSKRGLYALGVRVVLASLLMSTIAYGLHTGELGSRAPWDVNARPDTPTLKPTVSP